ncbi:MAG: glutaredoxin [Myxococcota bacterium]|jgi:glutaredoxin
MFGWLRKDSVDRSGGSGDNIVEGRGKHLALYKFDSCPYCRRLFPTIDRLDVNVEYRDTRADANWRKDLMEKTGRTQVPCLMIDGKPLFESSDIAAFLTQNFAVRS